MDQLRDFADPRQLDGCVYCGGRAETRDHVPSRILLDLPFPTNLPVVPACFSCNNGLSRDEEYLACLIECAAAGSTEPAKLRRPRVAAILDRSPALRSRLDASCTIVDGRLVFTAEEGRVENVVRKLALGHAAFDLSLAMYTHQARVMWWPLSMMTPEQRENFDAPHLVQLIGENGSRTVQQMLVSEVRLRSAEGDTKTFGLVINDWIEVQADRYRYLAVDDSGGPLVRVVIGGLLAADVRWNEEPTPHEAPSV